MIGQAPIDSAWAKNRLGKFTASKMASLLTEPKNKEDNENGELSKTAKTYVNEILSEILTLTHRELDNNAIAWGNMYEPMAAELLAIDHPGLEYFGQENPQFFPYSSVSGGSPDAAHKEKKKVFEIKVPENPSNHITYLGLLTPKDLLKCKKEYYYQIQFNMLCVAKAWGIEPYEVTGVFVSYCPLIVDEYKVLRLKQLEIPLDEEFYEEIDNVLERHENYLRKVIKSLNI